MICDGFRGVDAELTDQIVKLGQYQCQLLSSVGRVSVPPRGVSL